MSEKENKEVSENQEPSVEPKVLKVGEKEFDISTPEGLIQAQTWAEALTYRVGAQGNELGSLRKFRKQMEPTEDESKLLSEVAKLREDDKHAEADELILSFTRKQQMVLEQKRQVEEYNNKIWNEYFKSRPDLLEKYDEGYIKWKAEKNLDLAEVDDPYKAIDGLFGPKADSSAPQVTKTKEDSTPVIPGAMGGRAAPSRSPQPKEDTQDAVDFNDLFDELSVYKSK